jgi:hypothetical protein
MVRRALRVRAWRVLVALDRPSGTRANYKAVRPPSSSMNQVTKRTDSIESQSRLKPNIRMTVEKTNLRDRRLLGCIACLQTHAVVVSCKIWETSSAEHIFNQLSSRALESGGERCDESPVSEFDLSPGLSSRGLMLRSRVNGSGTGRASGPGFRQIQMRRRQSHERPAHVVDRIASIMRELSSAPNGGKL